MPFVIRANTNNNRIPMSKYMFLFRGGATPQSPEQGQAQMMKWKVWMEDLAKAGRMLGGEPLEMTGKVLTGRAKRMTDGPFAEGKEIIGGYLIVEAKDLNDAVESSKGCPIFDHENGSLEVRTVQEMNM